MQPVAQIFLRCASLRGGTQLAPTLSRAADTQLTRSRLGVSIPNSRLADGRCMLQTSCGREIWQFSCQGEPPVCKPRCLFHFNPPQPRKGEGMGNNGPGAESMEDGELLELRTSQSPYLALSDQHRLRSQSGGSSVHWAPSELYKIVCNTGELPTHLNAARARDWTAVEESKRTRITKLMMVTTNTRKMSAGIQRKAVKKATGSQNGVVTRTTTPHVMAAGGRRSAMRARRTGGMKGRTGRTYVITGST
mmetsp:Transcript_54556/g.111317  ORF Transcript_54556/g.111317 Transcript_54556/m.111317 type:complete len:249 (+) Transcript_54556:244-990(+)